MKLKYKIAVKFYTETHNEEQLNFAYKEIENFTENYNNFKWYYKFNLEKINNDFNFYSFDELDMDREIETLLRKGVFSEFSQFVNRYKYKIADMIFQKGNFNIDLIKYAIDKVIKKQKEADLEIDISSILNSQPSGSKCFVINESTSSNISLLFSFSLVIMAIALIFTHYYMYMKNPIKFFHYFQKD
jgi:hypothetical protein